MATSFKPVRKKAYVFSIGLVSQANTKILLDSTGYTISAADFKVWNSTTNAYATITTTPTWAVSGAGNKAIKITLTATEMDADNVVLQCSASGSAWCDQLIAIETREQKIDFAHFIMRDTSGNPATGKTVTVQVLRDNGTFATVAGTVVEKTNGLYYVPLTLTEMDAQDSATLYCTATGCMPQFITYTSAY